MARLALLGGRPVTKNLLAGAKLARRRDLERKYLLEAYDRGPWDHWPGIESMAAKFEREWAAFNRSRFCTLVTNGTHALQLALEVLDIGAGDEVVVPGLTWQATASAVCDVNAVPVLVDIDEETLCIDPKQVEAAVSPRTRAIIPVHLYHRMAEMDALRRCAARHRLQVIEDCAHTHGSRWRGRSAGTLGTLGCFSFQMSKLVTAGEGGAILMQDRELFLKIQSQRACGREFTPGFRTHGGNCRMTSFQAAILRGQLAAFRRNAPVIDRNGRALDAAVSAAPGVRPLRRSPRITRQCSYCYVFLYDSDAFDGLDAATFRKALSAELGLSFGTTYTPLSHSEVYYPHTKKRHHLSRAYLSAIRPSRWELPVCERVWRSRAVLAGWKILACPPKRAHLLTDAVAKVHDNRAELLAAQARPAEGTC